MDRTGDPGATVPATETGRAEVADREIPRGHREPLPPKDGLPGSFFDGEVKGSHALDESTLRTLTGAAGGTWPDVVPHPEEQHARREERRQNAARRLHEHAVWEFKNGLRKKDPGPFKPPPAGKPPEIRPEKSDAEKAAAALDRLRKPQHGETTFTSGDGRFKHAPYVGPNGEQRAKQTYTAPTPEEGNHAGAQANPVSFYGPASRSVPKHWGPNQGATDAREHGAEPVYVPLRDEKRTILPSGSVLVEPGKGEIRKNADGTPQTVQVRWKRGAEATAKGLRHVDSDKLPCHGGGMRAEIARSVEERTGKGGRTYKVDVARSRCPVCGQSRDVPRKVEGKSWEFPAHAPPREAKVSGFQDHGVIVVFGPEENFRDRAGDRIVATIERIDPDEIPAWIPTPDRPEQYYGMSVNLALGECAAGDRHTVRGFARMLRGYREAIARGENLALPALLTSVRTADGRVNHHAQIREAIAPFVPASAPVNRAAGKSTAAERAQARAAERAALQAGRRLGDVPVSEIEAHRIRKARPDAPKTLTETSRPVVVPLRAVDAF